MPGFNLAIGKYDFPTKKNNSNHLICETIDVREYSLNRFTLRKFEEDKLFVQRNDYVLVLEGVILNKTSLSKTNKNWEEVVWELYKQKGDTFFEEFRGSFSGALYDKAQNKWIIFTDHIGSKHLYYSKRGEELYLTSEIADLYALFKEHDLTYSLDEQGAYMLLSYGYMLNDFTLCSDIRKLKPGHFIKFENNNFSIHQYYTLPDKYDESIDENEAIEKVDQLFRSAIKLQFDKDREYGYKHLVALSGGLDSRMTTWVAHEMGYTNQLNFTFSQSNYLDETIAKEIASDLKHEWMFKALDNGLFLKEIDEVNKVSGGNILYYSLSHSRSAIKYINLNNLGMIHSGLLGDILKGDYYDKKNEGGFSSKLLSRVDHDVLDNIGINEIRKTKQRAFNGIHHSLVMTNNYTEGMSPFYEIELLDYSLTINPNIRSNRKLYKKWISKKYPKAADYVWESTKSKLTDKQLNIFGKEIPIKQLPDRIFRKLGLKKDPKDTAFHMNPLGYWYKTNPELKEFQDNYFNENIDRLDKYKELKKDCIELYQMGNGVEKNQVLTLLSALKLFFN